jgi:hypothetical protein
MFRVKNNSIYCFGEPKQRNKDIKHHAILPLTSLDQRAYHEPGSTTTALVER